MGLRAPEHALATALLARSRARGTNEARETRKGQQDMNHEDDIELHELETIECNLSAERSAEPESTDALASQSASGFMMASASGFMMASASGFMMA